MLFIIHEYNILIFSSKREQFSNIEGRIEINNLSVNKTWMET